ncbi:importin-9-like [Styela clava]
MAQSDKNMAEQILSTLSATMNPDPNIRRAAEQEIKILEVTEDFCVHLAKITVDQSFDLSLRQLASLILKQYVDTHWSSISEKFSPPEASENAKIAIRQMLPIGLADPQRKIRTSIAYAISAIAGWDWPENWPGLFESLMQALTSQDPNAVHGAMRVLTEFIRDVTDTHMNSVVPVLLPQIYKIFTETDLYNIRVRSRAVSIFNTCASFASEIGNAKDPLRVNVSQFLPNFLQAYVKVLKISNSEVSDPGLKKEVMKTLTILLRGFEKEIKHVIAEILPAVWGTFTNCAEMYVKKEVMSVEGHDDAVDSDGEGTGFESLVYCTFEFIECMLELKSCRGIVKQSLEDLIYHLILYMQVTEEQISIWSENPDQFVQDEDDETFSYSVRISAQDLFLTCCREFQSESAINLIKAVDRHVRLANEARISSHPCWWKSYEALMLALGSVESLVSRTIEAGNANFDVNLFITSIVLPSIKASEFPFLVGRAIWVASRFTCMLQPDMLTQFLEYTVHGLKDNQPPSIRISAVRAACNYCDHLEQIGQTEKLSPYCASLLEGLVQLAMQASVETLALVLEAIGIVLKVNDDVTAKYEPQITSLTFNQFLRHNNDPFIVSLCSDVLEVLSANKKCNGSLVDHIAPALANIFTGPPAKISANLVGISLELLTVIIRNTDPPFSDLLVKNLFPVVVNSVTSSDDNSVIQNGGDCIRAFVSRSPSQVISWTDQEGISGWHYVLRVASHLLDPQLSEHSAAFVGRLVGVMIRECGSQLQEVLDQLLRAVLSKLQQAKTLTVTQSLLIIFAYLFKHELVPTLEFLSKVPGPKGNTALEFVMTEWCDKQNLFYGHYDTKVCILALAELFKHVVATNDTRMNEIMVKGDQIFTDTPTVRTRSRAKKEPEKWTSIPLPLKLLKILIAELGHAIDLGEATETGVGNGNDDDGWEDEDDEDAFEIDELGNGDAGNSRVTLSELLDSVNDGFTAEDLEGDEDDPDVLADPLNSLELRQYLLDYFRQFCNSSAHKQYFGQQLNKTELDILARVGL